MIALLWALAFVGSAFSESELKLPLEHSLDGGVTFDVVGTLHGYLPDPSSGSMEIMTLLRRDLSEVEQRKMADLINSNGVYQMRLPADPSQKDGSKLLTSVPARCVVDGSSLSDRLVVHATAQGSFQSFNHNFARHPCRPETVSLPAELQFPETAEVQVWKPEIVPILTKCAPISPDGSKKGRPAKRKPGAAGTGAASGDASGDSEEPEIDNRPWIVKNWMIALPVGLVAFNALGALMAPPEQPGQGPTGAAARRR